LKDLDLVEKQYKQITDTSKMVAAAPPVSKPQIAAPGTSRIDNIAKRLETGLSDND